MSLDVYLKGKPRKVDCICDHCSNKHTCIEFEEYFTSNITHNLGEMAQTAGIYEALWRPEEIGITKAHQLIDLLKNGLNRLKKQPEYYKKFNSENGWGDYYGLVSFVKSYLKACEECPDAIVQVDK